GYEETRRDHVDAAMLECRNEVVQLEREPLKRIDAELTRDVSQHRRAFTARLARRIRIHERRLDREAHTQTDLAGVRERQVVRFGRAAACRQHGDQYRGEEWPAGVASAAMPYVDASFHESSMRRCDSPFDAGRAPVRRVSGVSGPPCSRGIRPVRPGAGPWQVRGRTGCDNFNRNDGLRNREPEHRRRKADRCGRLDPNSSGYGRTAGGDSTCGHAGISVVLRRSRLTAKKRERDADSRVIWL